MHDACCLCNTCTYPYTHACTRIHSDSPSPHIAEAICYFSCYVHRVSNDSKTDTKRGRICDICIYLHAYATHTCAFPQRLPRFTLPLVYIYLFLLHHISANSRSVIIMHILYLCIMQVIYYVASAHYIIHACDVGMHAHLNAMHTCS